MGEEDVTLTANFVPLVIQAIYSETDNSLMFINDRQYSVGETYNGKTVTAVYTGFTTTYYSATTIPWYSYRSVIKKVEVIDEIKPINLQNWFYEFTACTEMNLKKLNTTSVTSMTNMFNGCSSLTTLDISSFDTSKVTTMANMFNKCTNLTTLKLGTFSNPVLTDTSSMFSECTNLVNLDLTKFNKSNVTNMNAMFFRMKAITSLDLSNFETVNVTSMTNMFNESTAITYINFEKATFNNVTSYSSMIPWGARNAHVVVKDDEQKSLITTMVTWLTNVTTVS